MLETLDYTIRIGSTRTFLYFDFLFKEPGPLDQLLVEYLYSTVGDNLGDLS